MPLARPLVAVLLASAASLTGCMNTVPLPPKAARLNEDGAAALAAGDLTTAEARLQVAIEYSPKFVEAWVNLGLVELRRGNLKQAEVDLEKACDLNPDLPAPHHGLGLLADERHDGAKAEMHYREALKVDPGFAPARANLGRRLFERGAFEEAREQYLRLTEVVPESIDGWTGLVETLVRLGREGEADQTLARARTRFGDAPAIVLLVARQLLRRGAYDRAEAILAPLTRDATRSAAAWSWIAVSRLARHDRMGAKQAVREALAADPADSIAHYADGQISAGAGTPSRR